MTQPKKNKIFPFLRLQSHGPTWQSGKRGSEVTLLEVQGLSLGGPLGAGSTLSVRRKTNSGGRDLPGPGFTRTHDHTRGARASKGLRRASGDNVP